MGLDRDAKIAWYISLILLNPMSMSRIGNNNPILNRGGFLACMASNKKELNCASQDG